MRHLIRAAPSLDQLSRACAVTMPMFSTLPAIVVGKKMVKILLAVLVLLPSPHLAKPFSFNRGAFESGISR